MFYYTMYHKRIKSNFEIKEAIAIEEQEDVDITIEEAVPPQFILDDISKGYVDHITDTYMWFYLKDSYLFYIKDGTYILTHNMGKESNAKQRNCFLTGLSMAIALTQQGYIPLHGSVVQKDDQTLVICGTSGSGKSSTTLELMKRGYRFMADDLAVIDSEKQLVLPGFPMQRLCRDVVQRLTLEESRLVYLGERKDKYGYMLEETQYTYEDKPIKVMVQLKLGEQLSVRRISGMKKVEMLIHNTYCSFFYENRKVPTEILKKYFRVAEKMEIYEIVRPRNGNSLDEIVGQIEKIILQSC